MFEPLVNLAGRAVRRIVEIPTKGLPRFGTKDSERGFDEQYGVDTSSLVRLTNIFSKNFAHGHRYEGCNPHACRWAIERSGIETRDFWFVDVGCGKGRPLIIASHYGFSRLIGIEYSARLCRKAVDNLTRCGVSPSRFEITCVDAAEYNFPQHDLFVYFYNPFDEIILRSILAHLHKHRHLLSIAFSGAERAELANHRWLRRVAGDLNTDLYEKTLEVGIGASA